MESREGGRVAALFLEDLVRQNEKDASRRVKFAKSTYSDIGNFRKVPLKQEQINARPSTTAPQHSSIPEDRHSNPAPQRVPNYDQRSKIHAQHHSKSIVLLMKLAELRLRTIFPR